MIGGKIEPCPFSVPDANLFDICRTHKITLKVWNKSRAKTNHNAEFACIFNCTVSYPCVLNVHYSEGHMKYFKILDEGNYFASHYVCPNGKFNCSYKTSKKNNFERHKKICQDPKILREKLHCKQIEFGPRFHPIHKLKDYFTTEPEMSSFIFYDIESLVKRNSSHFGQTEILSDHHILSIAANAFVNGEHRTESWVCTVLL